MLTIGEARFPLEGGRIPLCPRAFGLDTIVLDLEGERRAALVDRSGKKALERPVAHMSTDSLILAELMNDPMALVSPIVRNGSRVTVGADEAEWKRWVELEKAAAR